MCQRTIDFRNDSASSDLVFPPLLSLGHIVWCLELLAASWDRCQILRYTCPWLGMLSMLCMLSQLHGGIEPQVCLCGDQVNSPN